VVVDPGEPMAGAGRDHHDIAGLDLIGHAVAKDVVAIDNDVSDIDADAKGDDLSRADIALPHPGRYARRTGHRVQGAGKFDKCPVAGGLDDAAVAGGDRGLDLA
jgi:hypothetical protein